MTRERAQYILDNTVIGGDLRYAFPRKYAHKGGTVHADGLTEQEDREVKRVWDTLPGSSCYNDALRTIAAGETAHE